MTKGTSKGIKKMQCNWCNKVFEKELFTSFGKGKKGRVSNAFICPECGRAIAQRWEVKE